MNRSVLSLPSHYPPLSVLWICTTAQHAVTCSLCQIGKKLSCRLFIILFVLFLITICVGFELYLERCRQCGFDH